MNFKPIWSLKHCCARWHSTTECVFCPFMSTGHMSMALLTVFKSAIAAREWAGILFHTASSFVILQMLFNFKSFPAVNNVAPIRILHLIPKFRYLKGGTPFTAERISFVDYRIFFAVHHTWICDDSQLKRSDSYRRRQGEHHVRSLTLVNFFEFVTGLRTRSWCCYFRRVT